MHLSRLKKGRSAHARRHEQLVRRLLGADRRLRPVSYVGVIRTVMQRHGRPIAQRSLAEGHT